MLLLPTLRDYQPLLQGSGSSGSWAASPETSVANHQATPRNITEEPSPELHRGFSPKPRKWHVIFTLFDRSVIMLH
jgi:hypothetical protein